MSVPYTDLNQQFIAGEWVKGGAGRLLESRDPFTSDLLTTIDMAGQDELDAAYDAAAKAQREWANRMPAERAAVMRQGRGDL